MLNQEKTGKFIAEVRKEHNLTQKQLAEVLGVTDKAISKWECGRSMPDNSILIELCQVLEINVNELLSGERLSEDSYSGKAEENIMSLMKVTEEQQSKQKYAAFGTICGFVALAAALLLIMLGAVGGEIRWFFDFPSILGIVGITLIVLAAAGMMRDFFRGFAICYGKEENIPLEKIVRAWGAYKVVLVTVLLAGGFMFVVNVVGILGKLLEPASLGPAMLTVLMALFYGFFIDLLLMPTAARLRMNLYEAEHRS